MAMFERDKAGGNDGPGTVVGANVRLTGILKDSNDITIHGEVEGEVVSESNVTITETAIIKGPISAENIVIAGAVNGAVTAHEKIELQPSGKVFGSMTMKDLAIHSGAVFIGKSTMPGEGKSSVTAKATPATAASIKKPVGKQDAGKSLTYEVEE